MREHEQTEVYAIERIIMRLKFVQRFRTRATHQFVSAERKAKPFNNVETIKIIEGGGL